MRRAFLPLAAAVVLTVAGCGGPAQIGADEQTFKAVDALYTAVTSHDPRLLDQCDQRLRRLHAAGKLPDAAWQALEKITARARQGKWQPAAEDLYTFMRGQRRGK